MSAESPVFRLGIASTGSTASRVTRRSTGQAPPAPFDRELYIKLSNMSLSNPARRWFILPPRCTTNMSLYNSLTVLPKYGYRAALEHLDALKLKNDHLIFAPCPQLAKVPDTTGFLNKPPEFFKEYRKLVTQNQQFRWKMKQLIHRWRFSKLRQINTTDIATMEEPKEPIYLYDWSERCKYVLEATTLLKDVLERLQYSVELFPRPMNPRNPFTNKPLTVGQIHFLLKELQRKGHSHWILGAFREGKYSLLFLQTVYFTPLKVNALKRIFRNPVNDTCMDIVYDFILAEYEYHHVPYKNHKMWAWQLENRASTKVIANWRDLCYKYYYSKYTSPETAHSKLETEIHTKSRRLTYYSLDKMIEEYNATVPPEPVAPAHLGIDPILIETIDFILNLAELGDLSGAQQGE